ncbi:MAG: S8 family serine peptidase [Planctomycetota bacterium]|nr:S8 family serine peptidase [Planctomycetota bacterium]
MRAGTDQIITGLVLSLLTPWVAADVLHPVLESDERGWYQRTSVESPLGVDSSVVCVQLHQGVPLEAGEDLLRAWGGQVYSRIESLQGLVVELPTAHLAGVSRMPLIRWIEPVLPPLEPTADEMRECSDIDVVQAPPWLLDGSGVTLTLVEVDLPSDFHSDLEGRVQHRTGGSVGGHPTHVAGIMAGDGSASSGTFRGVAPGAMIDAYVLSGLGEYLFYTDPGSLESIYANQIALGGAAAFNQSMGINVGLNQYPCWLLGDYGMTSALLDELARGSQGDPVVSVWSAGNERGYDHCSENYGTVAPPACAKNILTVGAVYSNTSNVTWFSGWGPTDDGRIKPDVVAAGSQIGGDNGITSCALGGGYESRSGTSMSAPVVTGIVGLMQQAWTEAVSGSTDPLPSTYRAILCHTAEDRWTPGPDYRTGWGLVDAVAAVSKMSQRTWQEGELANGELLVLPFEVSAADSNSPLRITMAWDDLAALPGNNAGLVNDLDLILQAPDGSLFYPWTLNPNDPEAAATRDVADRLNPIEQVQVDTPEPGIWNALITHASLEQGPQSFSLVSDPPLPITTLSFGPLPEYIPLDETLEVLVRVDTFGESVIPGSEQVRYDIDGGGYQSVPLVIHDGDWYRAELPVMPCGSSISFYAQVESSVSGIQFLPLAGDADPIVRQVGPALTTVFTDSFEADQGWSSTGDAQETGYWTRGTPYSDCTWAGAPSSDAEPDSTMCMFTGIDSSVTCQDVNNGCVVLTSPPLMATGTDVTLSYYRYFSSPNESWPWNLDSLSVSFSVDDGLTWHQLETIVGTDGESGQWIEQSWFMDVMAGFEPTETLRLRFEACDVPAPNWVEAAVDAVRIEQSPCSDVEPSCPADIAGQDGVVNIEDILALLAGFGLDDPTADIDGDGDVDIEDLLLLINAWGACD